MRMLAHTAACLLLVLPCAASALMLTSSPGLAIPDHDAAGIVDTIDTSGSYGPGDLVSTVSLTLAIDHEYVGELAIELTSPSGSELQVLARPGRTHPDEATGCVGGCGDSSLLTSTNLIVFSDGAFPLAETLGSSVGTNQDIPAGTFAPDADGWNTDITSFAGFTGEAAGGLWTLKVADYANNDTGTLVSWSLSIVPEPETGLLFALGLLGLAVIGRPRAPRTAPD